MNALREAGQLLSSNFCQFELESGDGKYCSAGAVGKVLGISLDDTQLYEHDPYEILNGTQEIKVLAQTIIENYLDDSRLGWLLSYEIGPVDIVYKFNDNSELEEILPMFEKAAAKLDEVA